MSIFNRRNQIQEMLKHTQELEGEVSRLRANQEFLLKDILTLQESEKSYKGNDYIDYATAIQEISNKYVNKADWGCLQTGAIIDLRAAFILGEGIQFSHNTDTREEAQAELDWVTDFFSYNGLDAEMCQEIAKEAEIEGKVALNIIYDPEPYKIWPGMVSTRFLAWTAKKYVIETDPEDYLWYKRLKWEPTGTTPGGNLNEAQFVYKKFGGRIWDPNDAQPKIMKCLTQIDRLDRALWDLRKINHLFASPTPDFEMPDAASVKLLESKLTDINWKIGKAIIHTGQYSLKGFEGVGVGTGVQNLVAEIELSVKMISGTTGIPIHYLGLIDLLKNRATGEDTRQVVMAATAREREIWLGLYEELINKAMTLFNEKVNAQMSKEKRLDPEKIEVDIPLITQEHWDHIEKVLIPAQMAGIISSDYVASQIPGIDMEQEAAKKAEKDADELAATKEELKALRESQNQVAVP